MEQIVEQVLNAENWRVLAILAFGLYGFVKLNTSFGKKFYALDKKMDGLEASLNKRMDGLEASLNKRIDELKYNDFAHLDKRIDGLGESIKALTFTLEKNKFLEKEDKEYIDGRLDR